MVVYVEYVLIDNFVIDYLLLKATISLSGNKPKKVRLFISAIIGAIFSLIFPLIKFNQIFIFILKVLVGFLLILIIKEYRTIKSYIRAFIIFMLLTFLTGGAIYGLYSLFNIKESTEICIGLMIAPVYLIIKLSLYIISLTINSKKKENLFYDVIISSPKIEIKCRGFLDTGNALSHLGEPMVVIDKKIFSRLISCSIPKCIEEVSLSTVGGNSKNLAITLNKLVIYSPEPVIYNNVRAVVSKTKLDCDIILHPDLKGDNKC